MIDIIAVNIRFRNLHNLKPERILHDRFIELLPLLFGKAFGIIDFRIFISRLKDHSGNR